MAAAAAAAAAVYLHKQAVHGPTGWQVSVWKTSFEKPFSRTAFRVGLISTAENVIAVVESKL